MVLFVDGVVRMAFFMRMKSMKMMVGVLLWEIIMNVMEKLPEEPNWEELAIEAGFNKLEASEFAMKFEKGEH